MRGHDRSELWLPIKAYLHTNMHFYLNNHDSYLFDTQPPPGIDAPLMDTAETVYISSLALLKVSIRVVTCVQVQWKVPDLGSH